jgi:hypothetical protein
LVSLVSGSQKSQFLRGETNFDLIFRISENQQGHQHRNQPENHRQVFKSDQSGHLQRFHRRVLQKVLQRVLQRHLHKHLQVLLLDYRRGFSPGGGFKSKFKVMIGPQMWLGSGGVILGFGSSPFCLAECGWAKDQKA